MNHRVLIRSWSIALFLFIFWTDSCSSLIVADCGGNNNNNNNDIQNKNMVAYANHWEQLLLEEHRDVVEEFKERRKTWSRNRLEASGMSLFHVIAEPESEVLGEKIVKVTIPSYHKGSSSKLSLLRDKFTRGDVLLMTPENNNNNVASSIPRESLVVDVGNNWMSLAVGPTWPAGLWEMRRQSVNTYLVRLDRTASSTPLKAQMKALDKLRNRKAGTSAELLANLFFINHHYSPNNRNSIATTTTTNDTVTTNIIRNDREDDYKFIDKMSDVPKHFENYNNNNNHSKLEKDIRQALLEVTITIKKRNSKKDLRTTIFEPNASQKEAIVWSLQRTISLIRGPPGTGKTRVAALLIATALQLSSQNNNNKNFNENAIQQPSTTTIRTPEQRNNENDELKKKPSRIRVLAVTHSNGAADVLLEGLLQIGVPAVRLGRPATVSPNVQHRTIAALSEKLPEIKQLRASLAASSSSQQQQQTNAKNDDIITTQRQTRASIAFDLKQYLKDAQETILKTAPVIVTSCIGAKQLMNDDFDGFSIVVLDEAAQTTEPALMCALAAAKANQLVFVGDTRQLPPTVTSVKLQHSMGVSPMARLEKLLSLSKKYNHNNKNEQQQQKIMMTLKEQYRMPPALLEHPSQYFYDGLVTCAAITNKNKGKVTTLTPKGFPWPSPHNIPLAFVQTGNDSEVLHNLNGGKSNPTEVAVIQTIVSQLLKGGEIESNNIAIITPYSKQVQLIRSELSGGGGSGGVTTMARDGSSRSHPNMSISNVRVGTVDSFQGQETDIVIFSTVRSNLIQELGFLRDARRLNVAITRAKRGLIIVGDSSVLRTCRHWAALLQSIQNRDCFMNSQELLKSTNDLPKNDTNDDSKNNITKFATQIQLLNDRNDDENKLLSSLKPSMEGTLNKEDELYGLFD